MCPGVLFTWCSFHDNSKERCQNDMCVWQRFMAILLMRPLISVLYWNILQLFQVVLVSNCCFCCSIVNSGAYRIINGTCAHEDTSLSTLAEQGRCPALRDLDLQCKYQTGHTSIPPIWLILASLIIPVWMFRWRDKVDNSRFVDMLSSWNTRLQNTGFDDCIKRNMIYMHRSQDYLHSILSCILTCVFVYKETRYGLETVTKIRFDAFVIE